MLGAVPVASLPEFDDPLFILLPGAPGLVGFDPLTLGLALVPLASDVVLGIVPLSVGRLTTCCWLEPAFVPVPFIPSLQPAKASVKTIRPSVISDFITNLQKSLCN